MAEIAVLPNGDVLTIRGQGLVLSFAGQRRVLSTAQWLGGIREDLAGIYNFDLKDEKGYCRIEEDNYALALKAIGEKLGLDSARATGMTTAVSMADLALVEESQRNLTVTALATAGIERNGGCAGDPGSYAEEDGAFVPLNGTINIMLLINADLPSGALVQALTTAVEAKVAAVRKLRLPSLYSEELATGSGTDGIFVCADMESPLWRTDAGKHSLLGELIGKAVGKAVEKALINHSAPQNLNMDCQSNVLRRFGINLSGWADYLPSVTHSSTPSATDIWAQADSDLSCAVKARCFAGLCDDLRQGIGDRGAINDFICQLLEVDSLAARLTDTWYEYLLSHYCKS